MLRPPSLPLNLPMIAAESYIERGLAVNYRDNATVFSLLNSLKKLETFGNATTGFSANDIWETSAEIPYRWCVTTQVWVVLLIGWIKFPSWHDQSEALPRFGWWCVISLEFLCSFLRCHLAGKSVLASPNVGCFLRLPCKQYCLGLPVPGGAGGTSVNFG